MAYIIEMLCLLIGLVVLGIHIGLGYLIYVIFDNIVDYDVNPIIAIVLMLCWPVGLICCVVAAFLVGVKDDSNWFKEK